MTREIHGRTMVKQTAIVAGNEMNHPRYSYLSMKMVTKEGVNVVDAGGEEEELKPTYFEEDSSLLLCCYEVLMV